MDRPSVGRIVHYVAYGTPGGEFPAGVCRAAVITEVGVMHHENQEVNEEGVMTTVALTVINPTGLFFHTSCPYNGDKKPGSWHWPERY